MKRKTIGSRDRTWAGRRFQNFLGNYNLHPCGLYVSTDIDGEHLELVVAAFSSVPDALRKLACQYELTLNVSNWSCTMCENVCTIYADWDAYKVSLVSPHIELGRKAFGMNLAPYLVHEICHLWWRTRSRSARSAYTEYLVDSTSSCQSEVTAYVHEKFDHYLHVSCSLEANSGEYHPGALRNAKERWVEESFCETVAKLKVPDYKSNEDWTGTCDLTRRRELIGEMLELSI